MSVTGVIKFYDPARGFGFAKPDIGDEDVLISSGSVMRAKLTTELQGGQRVVFDIQRGGREGKGLRAINLRRPAE